MLDDSQKEKTRAQRARETHHAAMRHHSNSRPMSFVGLKLTELNMRGQWQ